MLQSILSNLAIILLLHLSMSMITDFDKKIHPYIYKTITISFFSLAIISMFYLPINIHDSYWVDMRSIPLVFLAYIQGWKVTLPTLLIASIWRFFMGGDGMVPGIIFGMVLPTLLGLLFHPHSQLKGHYVEKIFLIIATWFVCDFPIIFIVPNGLEIFQSIAFIRCTTFVITAVILYIFIIQNRQRRYFASELEKLAAEDSLTKLYNKRKFFEVIEEKYKCLKSNQYIAMLDIDHFKKINDTYGHIVGDQVLATIGGILKKYESPHITIGRYGGEEFIFYIENSSCEQTKMLLEQIRKKISSSIFYDKHGEPILITVSIGIAYMSPNTTILEAINIADTCLYEAKNAGRNRIIFPQHNIKL